MLHTHTPTRARAAACLYNFVHTNHKKLMSAMPTLLHAPTVFRSHPSSHRLLPFFSDFTHFLCHNLFSTVWRKLTCGFTRSLMSSEKSSIARGDWILEHASAKIAKRTSDMSQKEFDRYTHLTACGCSPTIVSQVWCSGSSMASYGARVLPRPLTKWLFILKWGSCWAGLGPGCAQAKPAIKWPGGF